MASRSRADPSVLIVHGTQVVFKNRSADSSPQVRAGLLVSSKMYPAVNARVGDVAGNLLKRAILQDDVGHRRIRQRDRMASLTVKTPQDLGGSIASTTVVGGIARKARSYDEWGIVRIGVGL